MSDSMQGPATPDGGQGSGPGPETDPRDPPGQREAAGPGAAGAEAALPAPDQAAPRPLGVERVPSGNPAIDEQLARLADADHLPADGHVEVYEDVHRGLRDALTALDVRQGPQGPAPVSPTTSPAPNHRS